MKVLVIDDSRASRLMLRAVVAGFDGARVEEARDGAEGLERAAAFGPDLVLVDWTMPGTDGMGFLRAFRRTGTATPVIMLATECERPRMIEALAAGADNFVIKPFTPDLLSQRISETLAA